MTATRRLAAILAADVAGYSRLMGGDEEGTLAALKAIRRELGDPKIAEHRGRIVKTTGDGLLVEFQSVVDAVRCAVEMQRAMAERNADVPAGRRIEFRIGINLGDVILDDGDIYGDGVNLAARLEALAEPGDICVSRVVREQVGDKLDLAFEDGGEQQVKNIARPVHVFRIPIAGHTVAPADLGRAPQAEIRRLAAAALAPTETFIGRRRELEVLRDAFDEACAGHGRIVMLAGEPGIGKTRTAQELAVHAAEGQAVVFWGRCNEEAGAPPYWPWVQILGAALRDLDPDLLAGLGTIASDIADIVPEIRELLPGLEPSARLGDASEARFRMFEFDPAAFRKPGPAPAPAAGARRFALGRCAVLAPARIPGPRARRNTAAPGRDLPCDRAVAPAPAVERAGRPGADAAFHPDQPRRAQRRGGPGTSSPMPGPRPRPGWLRRCTARPRATHCSCARSHALSSSTAPVARRMVPCRRRSASPKG